MYKDTFNAFNTVTSQLDVRPPVDPTRLFESNDYEGGIKLLAEEYWLGFHVKNQSELESLVASLSAKIEGLTLLLDEQTGQKLRLMNEKLARSKPVDSLLILEEVKNLKQIIDGVLNDVSGEITQIQRLVDSFPGTTKVIPFEVYNYSTRLQSLKLRNLNAKPTIRDSSKRRRGINGVPQVLWRQQESRREQPHSHIPATRGDEDHQKRVSLKENNRDLQPSLPAQSSPDLRGLLR